MIDLSVPITGGDDVLEQRSGRHGIPLSALTDPQGGLIRYCGIWDHTPHRHAESICWEHWRQTGIPSSDCSPTTQEILDSQYTQMAGLPPVPELQAQCSAETVLLECDVTGTSGLSGFDDCTKTWREGIHYFSAPLEAEVALDPGTHLVSVRCVHPTGQTLDWSGSVTVPSVVAPPPPPEPPPPEPDPEPDPAPDPECPEPPECSDACSDLADVADRIADGVAWAVLPDGKAVKVEDGRYRFGSHRDWRAVETLIQQCREETASGCRYVPKVPSTGRVEVEVVTGDER